MPITSMRPLATAARRASRSCRVFTAGLHLSRLPMAAAALMMIPLALPLSDRPAHKVLLVRKASRVRSVRKALPAHKVPRMIR